MVDTVSHRYPIGPQQMQKFADGATDYGLTNYYTDPRALKLISQTEWDVLLTRLTLLTLRTLLTLLTLLTRPCVNVCVVGPATL